MHNEKVLTFNKALSNVALKLDNGLDPTTIRIGKQRVARIKNKKRSNIKQAILENRNDFHSSCPVVVFKETSVGDLQECDLDEPGRTIDQGAGTEMAEVDRLSEIVLKELARLQGKGKDQPPEKQYKYKKFVLGIREVCRAVKRNEVKGIIVAVNIEDNVDEVKCVLDQLRLDCEQKEIPVLSALTKRRLGKMLGKSMKQSIVGIVSLEGVHQTWRDLVSQVSLEVG